MSLILVAMPVLAQTDTSNTVDETANTEVTTSTPSADDTALDGIEIDNINAIPSAFGLWWRGVKENVSLGLTFDPIKKAEKSIKYAEERMRIAELIAANSTDQAVQERAQIMIQRAQTLMEKVEANQGKWAGDKDRTKVQRLMNNVAVHQMNQERAMNRIEQRLPEEAKDKFNALREKGLQASQRMMNALENENIPEETKAKLEAVKARIEEHASTTKMYIEKRKELHDKIKAGDETAIEELKQLNEDRKEDLKAGLEVFKDVRDTFRASSTERMMERIENRLENGAASSAPMLRERIENRIMNNGSTTSSMIQASGTPTARPMMPRR